MSKGVRLAEKLAMFSEHWSPKIVSTFNGHDVMVVRLKGEFVWHSHPDTDDFFLVLKGHLTIQLRDGNVQLGPGDLDRKSTRLNSSHPSISYAVFCLKKKKKT